MTRPFVFWAGDTPSETIKEALLARNLTLRHGPAQQAIAPNFFGQLNAVIVPVTDQLRTVLERLYTIVLSSGAHLEVLATNAAERQKAALVMSGLPGVTIQDLRDDLAQSIAERCARHDPGPSPNTNLTLSGEEITDTGRRLLFQRAFSDFEALQIERLEGGRSPAEVFEVHATAPGGDSAQPFVVKIGRPSKISAEINAMKNCIESFIPFRNRAPLVEARCVQGPDERFLTTLMVERAMLLGDYLRTHEPELAITAIFAGPLRNWREDITREEISFHDHYRGRFIPNDAATLQAAWQRATQDTTDIGAPAVLCELLKQVGNVEVFTCYSHGDLHAGNIFVTYGGTDVILIDFAGATRQQRKHAALDLAVLDVSLIFDGQETDLLPVAATSELYTPPLLLPRRFHEPTITDAAANRRRAVRDLRSHGRGCCVTNDYDLAVACCLLRFARYDTFAIERRALAYTLASRLITYATAA